MKSMALFLGSIVILTSNSAFAQRKQVETGEETREEVSTSSGATVRVGANSRVQSNSDQTELDLEQGVIMVDTNKRGPFQKESVTVKAEDVVASANATMMISYQPERYVKIVCLAGKVTVSLKNLANETVTLVRGQMLIIDCVANILPDAVSVDMNRLMQTSPLLAPVLRNGPPGLAAAGGNGIRQQAGGPGQRDRRPPPQNAGPEGRPRPLQGFRPRPNTLPTRRMPPPPPPGEPPPPPPPPPP